MLCILIEVEGGVASVVGFTNDVDFQLIIMDQDDRTGDGTMVESYTLKGDSHLILSNDEIAEYMKKNIVIPVFEGESEG